MSSTVAFLSGKGGVGKTVLAIGAGQALAERGRRCLLIDAALGLANIDVQLGINDARHLGLALTRDLPLRDFVVREPESGLDLLLGPSGWQSLTDLDLASFDRLVGRLDELARDYDTVLLDLPAGIGARTLDLARRADRALVVVTDEPTSLTDAYASIKVGLRRHRGLAVVVNKADSDDAGVMTHDKLRRTCRRFLSIDPPLAGIVRRDRRVPEAIAGQTSVLKRFPDAQAAADLRRLASELAQSREPAEH